jgi:hypothetical protein
MSESMTAPGDTGLSDGDADTPVLDVLATMTAASIEATTLDPQTLLLTRVAALAAVDAPPLSYLLNLKVAGELGVTAEQVQGVLVAIAPIVGAPRIIAAAGNITRAIGIEIAVAEAELLAELEAEDDAE